MPYKFYNYYLIRNLKYIHQNADDFAKQNVSTCPDTNVVRMPTNSVGTKNSKLN